MVGKRGLVFFDRAGGHVGLHLINWKNYINRWRRQAAPLQWIIMNTTDNTTKEALAALSPDWETLTDRLETQFGRKPDLQAILFLIGIQESGQTPRKFKKEEKQDLMHVAVCHLLTDLGYFRFKGLDEDGWPHYEGVRSMPVDANDLQRQELILKQQILKYFTD